MISNGQTMIIDKQVVKDLLKIKEEFDAIVESLELMCNKGFMNSYRKAREQIKKREFDDWKRL